MSYDNTYILQAHGTVVVCCSVDLTSYSAMTRYIIREYGQESAFKQRPVVGTAMHLARLSSAHWNNDTFLLFTRVSNTRPLLHVILHLCFIDLVNSLTTIRILQVYFRIYDTKNSNKILPTWYAVLRDHFIDSNIDVILHDGVYVPIALFNEKTVSAQNTSH